MSDLRRQKRKAIREGRKNLTDTKIEDNLAAALDGYLKSPRYFEKQLDLCYKLKLDYPPKAKSGYELPLFNKNPITNEIEIHAKSAELFAAYQLTELLVDSTIGMDDESSDYLSIAMFLGVIDLSPEFAVYLHDLLKIGEEKGKNLGNVIVDNIEEINEKITKIVAQEEKNM